MTFLPLKKLRRDINMKAFLAKIAYDAYCENKKWKSVRGEPLPVFDMQSPELQQAWQEAALAVEKEVAKEVLSVITNTFSK